MVRGREGEGGGREGWERWEEGMGGRERERERERESEGGNEAEREERMNESRDGNILQTYTGAPLPNNVSAVVYGTNC